MNDDTYYESLGTLFGYLAIIWGFFGILVALAWAFTRGQITELKRPSEASRLRAWQLNQILTNNRSSRREEAPINPKDK